VVRHVATAVCAAALVTITIFFLMMSLVARDRSGTDARRSRTVMDFVRIRRDSEVETKVRERPQKKLEMPDAPMVPELRTAAVAAPTDVAVPVAIPTFRPSFSLGGGTAKLDGGPDMDVVPLVRVNPLYPARAQARGIEGWVHLRFTITPQGTTKDIEVLDADPRHYFERAARDAVRKYKYKPKVEGGVPVERPGVEIVVSFELDD
jgi:protein TonB